MNSSLSNKWASDILPKHPMPANLHPWQKDTISHLIKGDSVALCVPTGSGKTLPQLASSLFFDVGVAIVIPPLISIEQQLESLCVKWKIPCLNLSNVRGDEVISRVSASSIKVIIASIERISDMTVQKSILNLQVSYISVDECQVMDSENGWTSFRPYVPQT